MANPFFALCPQPPEYRFDATALWQEFTFLSALDSCPQSPVHHAEGDVGRHTRMVCEWLTQSDKWRNLDESDRRVTFWAALLHDIAKPATTRLEEDGRITSRGHSLVGEIMARTRLWELNAPFSEREMIAQIIRFHQFPFFLVERENAKRKLYEISQSTRCNLLAITAEADARGRVCQDQERLFENIELFLELAIEEDCLTIFRKFPSSHSRFLYFRRPERDPNYLAFDDTVCEVILLSGLPGSGKSTWAQENFPALPQVCLDDIRRSLKIKPTDEQGAVMQAARELARTYLRRKESFIWNATNLSRQRRQQLIELVAAYNARVRIVYIEVSEETLYRQNQEREYVVPMNVLRNMIAHWEVPDLTEAHQVDYQVSARR